jgi:hypothetical protein
MRNSLSWLITYQNYMIIQLIFVTSSIICKKIRQIFNQNGQLPLLNCRNFYIRTSLEFSFDSSSSIHDRICQKYKCQVREITISAVDVLSFFLMSHDGKIHYWQFDTQASTKLAVASYCDCEAQQILKTKLKIVKNNKVV